MVFWYLVEHGGIEPPAFVSNVEISTFVCIVATQGATHIYINHDNKSGRPFQVLRSSAFVLFLKMFTLTSQILS